MAPAKPPWSTKFTCPQNSPFLHPPCDPKFACGPESVKTNPPPVMKSQGDGTAGPGGGMIIISHPRSPVAPVLSCTSHVKSKVPAVVGVPVMNPVVGSSERPGGNAPEMMEKVKGGIALGLVTPNMELYGTPVCPELAGHVHPPEAHRLF